MLKAESGRVAARSQLALAVDVELSLGGGIQCVTPWELLALNWRESERGVEESGGRGRGRQASLACQAPRLNPGWLVAGKVAGSALGRGTRARAPGDCECESAGICVVCAVGVWRVLLCSNRPRTRSLIGAHEQRAGTRQAQSQKRATQRAPKRSTLRHAKVIPVCDNLRFGDTSKES